MNKEYNEFNEDDLKQLKALYTLELKYIELQCGTLFAEYKTEYMKDYKRQEVYAGLNPRLALKKCISHSLYQKISYILKNKRGDCYFNLYANAPIYFYIEDILVKYGEIQKKEETILFNY